MNIESILKSVSKPGRYVGGEYGEIIKNKAAIKARVAFCFPDSYEIGMSNLGVRLLYGSLNQADDVWCERVYAPWPDMEDAMRANDIPLYALESGDPLREFDFVAFTLQYELSYTNVLNMLELSGIPMLASERGEGCPIILGGGPCAYNAEPVADFFDIFSIGEGEEALPELARLYINMKDSGSFSREEFLKEAAKLPGFYVPSLYDVSYNPDGTVRAYTPKYDFVPERVTKRIIADLDRAYFPDKVVMPFLETVHDRIMLEVFRGCIRGCRFCQAGMIYRPVREKSPEVLECQAKCLYENTGYDEISLSSLSISDYSKINELTENLVNWTDKRHINLSLPSMRLDAFTSELMARVSSVRDSGLTFAPEAGTQRLRDVINKNVTNEDLSNVCRTAFGAGKSQVKLYFMLGLPTETNEDIEGIAQTASLVLDEYFALPKEKRKGRPPQVTLSTACFIPKPFTPFQWVGQTTMAELEEKQRFLRSKITDRRIRYNYHDAKTSLIEAVLARGDRRISKVLLETRKLGMKFDSWDEYFSFDKWMEAFDRAGIDPAFYANRTFGTDEILPWDVIDCGVDKRFLLREYERAKAGIPTQNCRQGCAGCGANKLGGERSCCPKTTK